MIDVHSLTTADIGKYVEYRGGAGEREAGRIKSWNDSYIFVVYPGHNISKREHYDRYTAAATNPCDLFLPGEKE